MRIIDLLNKIANGEEVPKAIDHNGELYIWWEKSKWYFSEPLGADLFISKDRLNDEVEIIEEEKKIEKLNENKYVGTDLSIEEDMFNKINEIIDKINEMEHK